MPNIKNNYISYLSASILLTVIPATYLFYADSQQQGSFWVSLFSFGSGTEVKKQAVPARKYEEYYLGSISCADRIANDNMFSTPEKPSTETPHSSPSIADSNLEKIETDEEIDTTSSAVDASESSPLLDKDGDKSDAPVTGLHRRIVHSQANRPYGK
jgi:hypothetical protein